MFDQILIRPDLLDFFKTNNLEIVTEIRGISLLSASGKPDKIRASDHLPIIPSPTPLPSNSPSEEPHHLYCGCIALKSWL